MSYSGWKNYETWNVALWIGNDESLYSMARRFKNSGYVEFTKALRELYWGCGDVKIAFETPDGVPWNDSGLDVDALDEFLSEL